MIHAIVAMKVLLLRHWQKSTIPKIEPVHALCRSCRKVFV
jgi:hypothetical protein